MKTQAVNKTRRSVAVAAIALGSALAVAACDSLLEVELPAQLTDDALANPTAAGTILSTFITHFENAYNDIVWEQFGREDGGEVPTTREPSADELAIIRDVLDPKGLRFKEVPA